MSGGLCHCAVKNIGSRSGTEVAQLYITYPDLASEPPSQLKGFHTVFLQPGQVRTVSFSLTQESLGIWDVQRKAFVVPQGTYKIHVGASSQDIRASADVMMGGSSI